MIGPWTESKWGYDELQDATVEFRLVGPKWTVSGVGKFEVAGNPEGRLKIDIIIKQQPALGGQIKTNFHLGQECVSKIRKHPDQGKAKFQLEC